MSKCFREGMNGLKFRYKFLMTNGLAGDYWHEHFSADEFYILPVLMGFFFIYMLLVIAVILCASELKSRQLLHSTYKLFALSVYLQEMGILTQGLAYIRYSVDGIGSPVIKTLARMVEASSEGTFLLLLLLMAKGYTITRGRLRVSSAIKITIFMCIYTVTYCTLFIYEQMFFDPGEVLYIYESPAGYGLIVLRIIAWWMFIYFTVITLKHYPEKTTFYYPFNLVGTLWFVAGPTFILAANTMVDKWVRESVVCFVLHLIALVGHVLFLLLTVPSRANKNFPYHVRTTQIGIMEITDGVAGNNSLDAFGHHPYAPGGPPSPWPRVPVGLFTIAQSNCSVSTNGNSMMVRRQSMAVRRVYTPESLVLRHEEILPNANFMACMIRTELQTNTRSADVAVPLRAIPEERQESGETESGDISEDRTEERDSQQRRPSELSAGEGTSGNILKSERNPFIVTTTNQPAPASSDTENTTINGNRAFKNKELEEATTHHNGDIVSSEESLGESDEPAEESSSTNKHQTSQSNNLSIIKSNCDRNLDDSYDANFEESFAINIDRTKFQREPEEGYSIASFPRDEDLRSSIRKLPPLNLTEESKKKVTEEDDIKSNGVLPEPAYSRAENRVHFKL